MAPLVEFIQDGENGLWVRSTNFEIITNEHGVMVGARGSISVSGKGDVLGGHCPEGGAGWFQMIATSAGVFNSYSFAELQPDLHLWDGYVINMAIGAGGGWAAATFDCERIVTRVPPTWHIQLADTDGHMVHHYRTENNEVPPYEETFLRVVVPGPVTELPSFESGGSSECWIWSANVNVSIVALNIDDEGRFDPKPPEPPAPPMAEPIPPPLGSCGTRPG